ncbi:hypothetical protein [Streptomyces sp. T12]|uniref:hypothetical protein n=1 Tax=Streptomyces sp. T12 TaxID=477697 RepID=UPI0035A2DF29
MQALGAERRVSGSLAASVGLRPARPGLPAGAFSGGDQQKLVPGRWINEARDVEALLLPAPMGGSADVRPEPAELRRPEPAGPRLLNVIGVKIVADGVPPTVRPG